MDNSDVSEDELPLAVRRKAKKKKKAPKKTPVKRIRKKKVRNLPAVKPIECPDCGLRFHFLSKLKDHQRHHTGEKPFECDMCQKAFSQLYSLRTHKLIHTNEKPYKCNFCAYACRDTSTLRKHHYRHMGIVQRYNCNMCAKSFKLKYMLKNHVAETHLSLDLRTHKCDRCDKKFKTKAQVKLHGKLVHDRIRATTCPICNKFLSNSSNLKTHLVSHVQEKPYMCGYPGCDKRYKDKGSLTKHSRVHMPDKQYSCSECGYLTTRRVRLRNHMAKVHQRTKCVECDYCGQKFYSKNYLIIHIGRKHDPNREQYICDMCGYKTKNKPAMVMHLKFVHEGIRTDVHCNLCKKTYKKHEYLKMHYKKTHNIAYKTHRDQIQKIEGISGNIKIKTEPIDPDDETPNDLQIKMNDTTDQTANETDETGIDTGTNTHQVKDPKGRMANTDRTAKKRRSKKEATPSQSTPPKVHKCEICGRFFKKLPRLKNHLVKVHGRTKCVSCEQCGQKFYSKNYLIDHMYKRHMHRQEYICDECGFLTHHKPGIVVHIKFAHATTAVQCDICKKKYKRMDLLQFHYSEAHGTSYDIATNSQESKIENVKVKVEPLTTETEAMDLFSMDNQQIPDRSLTRDGATSLKGLIERSGVRSVPETIFQEFCSGHIEYLPAGVRASHPKDPLRRTDKKAETQAAANINRLLTKARKERAKEKLERARQMYNERIKKILDAKEAAKLRKLIRKNDKKDKNAKPNETEKAPQNNRVITLPDEPITTLGNNSAASKSDDQHVTTLVDNIDANKTDDESTKDDADSDVTYISDVEDETDTQLTQKVVNKSGDEHLITLLEELNQMTTEPDASSKLYLEGKEMSVEDIMTGENYSGNEYIDQWLNNPKSTDDTNEESAKNKDVNNKANVEVESNVAGTTNELEVVNVTIESSKTPQNEISSGEDENEKSTTTKIETVLLTEHDYAKSEKTRQIELKFLQCPEKLFDKSFDTSEEDKLKNSDDRAEDIAVNGNFTLLDNGKVSRNQIVELIDEIPATKLPKKKKIKKKPNKKLKKDAVYENFDSATPHVFDIPKRTDKKRRKQKLSKTDCITDQEELSLIFKSKKNISQGNRDKTKPKVVGNILPDTNANDENDDEISMKHGIDSDNDANGKVTKEKTNKQSTWSFKYKILVEEVLRSFENQEVNEDLNEEMEKTALNKEVIALLKQTQEDAIENKTADSKNVQDRILIDKLKDIASSQSYNLNTSIAELLKSINEMFTEKSDDNQTHDLAISNEIDSEENNSSPSQENTSKNDDDKSKNKSNMNTEKSSKNKKERVNITKKTKKIKVSGLNKLNKHTDEDLSDKGDTTNCDDNFEEVTIKRKGRKRKIADRNYKTKKDPHQKDSNGNIDDQKDGPLKRSTRKIKLNRKYFEDSDVDCNEDNDNKVSNIKDNKNKGHIKDKKSEGHIDKEKKSVGKITFKTHQCYVCFKVFHTKEALIEHCKTHFSVDREKSLKICPLCDYTCTSGFSRHVKKVHDMSIKLPYARIQEELVDGETKYYFEINDPIIKRVEVIPSVKNLNRRAMVQLDREHREKDAKTILKHKLVKKGSEWVIEKEEMNLDNVVLPEFDKNIAVSDKISDKNEYFDSLKKLYHVSKKAGKKMMFPCQHCEKICQNLGALKLHNRKHEDNPAPFAPKVWKHKLAKNSQISKVASVATDDKTEAKKKKNLYQVRLKGVDKTNIEDVLEKDHRKAKPKPIKNNHRCDPQLQEFYRNNVRGGDIEFWQFLKIFNKMDRDNINDFKDLQGNYNYGIIDNDDLHEEILEDNFILQVGNSNGENLAGNSKNLSASQDLGDDKNESCTKSKKGKSNMNKITKSKNRGSNVSKVKKIKSIGIVSGSERDLLGENSKNVAIYNNIIEESQEDLTNDSNTSCSSNLYSMAVSNKTDDNKQIVKKFSVEERKRRAIEIANEVMKH